MKKIPILNIQQFKQTQPFTDFYSNRLSEHFEKNKELVHKPHKHNFFLCVLFTKGTGIHEIDFNSYPVTPGSVFFLKPGQTHYWKFEKLPEGSIFFHSQEFYDMAFATNQLHQFPFYYSVENPPTLRLSETKTRVLEKRFKEITEEYKGDLPYKYEKIASLLNLTYIDLARIYTSQESKNSITSTTYIDTLQKLERTIEKYYKTEKLARFYANKLHISTKHLNRISKSTLNKTTTDLITDRVLLESKRLIIHSDNSLVEISQLLGYEDYAYFSRVFKSKTHLTPLEFKKSYTSI